jgi:hypothetical protein
MALNISRVEYYYITVEDSHGKGYWLLEHLRQQGVGLVAFTAFPVGSGKSQLDFIVEDRDQFYAAMKSAGVKPTGPRRAFLIQGGDEVGAIVDLHSKLSSVGINVHAANGVSAGNGGFGYVLWVKPEHYEEAAAALGV